ncbi:hypothetical protein NYZ99_16680 [Maribacter litopenaei]|uniref:Uncharacterized protein n=1 Tax=Maribacter litopenaei TaxID=2976127 RepID=A0ABY5Y987_9FLAO|nr:hypothetical protein [Maribacter litopenaei]UWX54526.1 hypothetical protein NYZ99_16680 [Maribacter litopenaei]
MDKRKIFWNPRRYIAAEVAPSYALTKNTGVGLYYLHGRGFDEGVKLSHFFTLNSYFNNLYITNQLYFNVSPQAYYLRLDGDEGYYAVGFITLAKKDFPVTVSAIFNKALKTEIAPEDDFLWNISLDYRFGGNYRKRKNIK